MVSVRNFTWDEDDRTDAVLPASTLLWDAGYPGRPKDAHGNAFGDEVIRAIDENLRDMLAERGVRAYLGRI